MGEWRERKMRQQNHLSVHNVLNDKISIELSNDKLSIDRVLE